MGNIRIPCSCSMTGKASDSQNCLTVSYRQEAKSQEGEAGRSQPRHLPFSYVSESLCGKPLFSVRDSTREEKRKHKEQIE
jgi:hypothetical protein